MATLIMRDGEQQAAMWFIISGLRTGVVRARFGSYSRTDDPAWYWGCLALYAGLIAWFSYLASRIALDL